MNNNLIWQEAHCDEKNKWTVGKWIKDDAEEKQWKKEMLIQVYEFKNIFKETHDYKQMLLDMIKELQEISNGFSERYLRNVKSNGKEMADIIYSVFGGVECEKRLEKLKNIYTMRFEISKLNITPEMIVRAKEFPMEDLIEVNRRNFAICPFHPDRNPSFWVKNNRGYCFPCQKSFDTIQLLIDRDGVSFQEAVKRLANV